MIIDEQANGQWTEDFDQHDVRNIFHVGKEVIDSILREWGFYEGENYLLRALRYQDDTLDKNMALPYGFRWNDQGYIEHDPDEQALQAIIDKYKSFGLPSKVIREELYLAGFITKNGD